MTFLEEIYNDLDLEFNNIENIIFNYFEYIDYLNYLLEPYYHLDVIKPHEVVKSIKILEDCIFLECENQSRCDDESIKQFTRDIIYKIINNFKSTPSKIKQFIDDLNKLVENK